MSVADLSLREFLDRLASVLPGEPGGGAAAAVTGAMAAALLRMVGGLGARRSRAAEDVRRRWAELDSALAADQAELLAAADRDGAAYAVVLAVQRRPRNTPAATEARQRALQDALAAAAEEPLGVARRCRSLAAHRAWLEQHGHPGARSDIACACELARAARAMALATARSNIDALEPGPRREGLAAQAESLAAEDGHD